MENIFVFFDAFWKAYAEGFIMIALSGAVIALFIELFVKKAFDTVLEKAPEEKKEKIRTAKTWVCSILSVLLAFLCAVVIFKSSELPGGYLYFPEWFFLVFLVQYLMSMHGIKRIKEAWLKKGEKPEKPVKTKKKNISVDEGTQVFTRDSNGNFVAL